MLPHESALLHGMLNASHQWLGEVSKPSEIPLRAFRKTPFSAMYVGEIINGMRDYESKENNHMDEETHPHLSSDPRMYYSEEEWVRYAHELQRAASSLLQVVIETCVQT